MVYGYARVSGRAQATDGNSLESQEEALRGYGCQEIVREVYTGTKMDRPEFSRLIERMTAGDVLVVVKLDRFARSVSEGTTMIKDLLARGIAIDIMNMGGRFDNSPTGKLLLNVMMSFAEFERDMIVTRCREGKEAKRANGGKAEGRYEIPLPELEAYRARVDTGEMTVTEACKRLGISRRTWYNRSDAERISRTG